MHLFDGTNGKVYRPKASYTVNKTQKKEVCSWAKSLKPPDGYSSNIARCVNDDECKFYRMKSHDCHVFMQRLLPIALQDVFPKPKLSIFFRDICSMVLCVEHMEQLKKNIVEILHKFEKIFHQGFFDSMEHLPIHLAYEAKSTNTRERRGRGRGRERGHGRGQGTHLHIPAESEELLGVESSQVGEHEQRTSSNSLPGAPDLDLHTEVDETIPVGSENDPIIGEPTDDVTSQNR
ncbi:hypothetical protein Sango_0667400 [Sesamum angolense]|uniref:DUF4218 domain-containing protein n=1 Tax=Sesamum angolense TaxID=2727404 RepID=A0AAE2C2F8_9LAMI|nr:hypothetical protein Sango_0667400 [Sesamum angolense]